MKKEEPKGQGVPEENVDSAKVVTTAMNIIEQATTDVLPANNEEVSSNALSDSFKGLPMRELIAGPLLAAAEAQEKLAAVAWDFYQRIAYEGEGDKKTTRTLDFTINRPLEQNGELKMIPQKIQAPFIGLVPIPALLIDRIDVDFQMEVTETNVEKSESSKEASSEISGGWAIVKAKISGKVSSSRENTRTSNQTAKYQIHVTASQQRQTEGLSKLMDVMASCIEPIVVAETGK